MCGQILSIIFLIDHHVYQMIHSKESYSDLSRSLKLKTINMLKCM